MLEKIALLVSDLHLSDKPPIARSGEPDWYEAMARSLRELKDLAGDLLVLCGGDVFDRWRSPPKLINFAMRGLPTSFWSVMGQHDMPYHNWEERESSAFWTLVEGERIVALHVVGDDEEVEYEETRWNAIRSSNVLVRGFHWGEDLETVGKKMQERNGLKIAVAHKYCWVNDHQVPTIAYLENNVGHHRESLAGYDVALFGDNHKGFLTHRGGVTVFNAGTFMRRSSDEIDYKPMVGVLYEDGSVEPHYLDTSKEVMGADPSVQSAEKMMLNMDGFVEELRTMQDSRLRFEIAIERALEERGAGKAVRRIILEAMEGK